MNYFVKIVNTDTCKLTWMFKKKKKGVAGENGGLVESTDALWDCPPFAIAIAIAIAHMPFCK